MGRFFLRGTGIGSILASSLAAAAVASPSPPSQGCSSFSGKASWYGPGFQNLPTASGELFDENALTAASRTLPLHSWVTVTYRGRSVPVEITDRGPYAKGRIIDLSKRAATELGMKGVGVARVTISTCLLRPEDYVDIFNLMNDSDET